MIPTPTGTRAFAAPNASEWNLRSLGARGYTVR